MEIGGKKARLADSLMVNENQHTDVLTKELGRNSEQHAEVLPGKAEEKASEDFLSPGKDLELRMIESTGETIGSCDFEADNLILFTGDVEDSPLFEIVLEEEELLQVEDETIMSPMQKLITVGDKKELVYLYSQEKIGGKNCGVATIVHDEATIFAKLVWIARINQDDNGQLLKMEIMLELICSMLMKC